MDNCSSDVSFAVAENISTDLVFTTIKWPVFAVVAVLASLQIIFAIVCLLFNTIFRKRRIVKLTSPNLNYLIVIGVVFLSLSMIGYSYPFSSELALRIACPLRAVFLSVVGHNLCFVVQLTKLWRIYHAFHKPSHSKKIITDRQLFLFVAVAMAPDFIIYGVFLSLEIAYSNAGLYINREMSTQSNNQCFVFHSCGSSIYSIIRSILTTVYKFILHTVTFYLSIRLRKTKIPVLNDRIPVVLTVYTTSVLTILIVVTIFILQEYPNVFAGIFGACIWIDANVFLGLTFIPKMVLLHKDPNGVNIIRKKEMMDTTI